MTNSNPSRFLISSTKYLGERVRKHTWGKGGNRETGEAYRGPRKAWRVEEKEIWVLHAYRVRAKAWSMRRSNPCPPCAFHMSHSFRQSTRRPHCTTLSPVSRATS